jgi:tryptophan 2,3-dioxygenase
MPADDALTYHGYLNLDELLDQQEPVGPPAAHDELMFIALHQAYELWFKVQLHELADARDRMLAGETSVPRLRLRRCQEIQRVLHGQIDVLDTMTPQGFHEFRDALGSASGFQSTQFREIEFLSGLKESRWPDRLPGLSAADRMRLRRRLTEPTLWDGFLAALEVRGFGVSTRPHRFAAYTAIADGDDHTDLWELAEALVDHDQAWAMWRARHALVVERQIGARPGTGGSAGIAYLRGRTDLRFYPELWEARDLAGAAADAASR